MQDFEKLGLFYLGKLVNPSTGKVKDDLLLYESKNLTTHAVCVGMTGSGKTGLGITILEEAAIDKIPAIIIDPKGDLGNLLLTFPNLSADEFKPWVDLAEAESNGMDAETYAESIVKTWKDGLAAWGEGPERIQNLRKNVEIVIYTPANKAGIPISILSSFAAPSKEQMKDSTAIREKILSTTSSLLGLLGIDADPIKSREHILISNIIQQNWQNGTDLDISALIQQVQTPSFSKIGALDIDTFYPPKDRMSLSISLNNLLASPGFQAWMEGQPLDIGQLLYTDKGRPKLSIISIAHLSDPERMFFVTLLLNEFLSWMRRQPGTSSLRALLYMDEIFGFFPPTASPPSKLPMLTLLKQARAFGVGIVLATQNPVDLDYKGLSNCGTWFIGKLQTERDKARVLQGLSVASNGEVDEKSLDKMMALIGKRTFIMRSIYEKEPILFQTRWTLSYLRGPLTLTQIATLTEKTDEPIQEIKTSAKAKSGAPTAKPTLSPGINQFYYNSIGSKAVHYEPKVVGIAKMHFVDSKNNIDVWNEYYFAVPVDADGKSVTWEEASDITNLKNQLKNEAQPGSTFGELPSLLQQEKSYAAFAKKFQEELYQNQTLSLFQTSDTKKKTSKPGESEGDFRAQLSHGNREQRDDLVKKLRDKYAGKIAILTDKVRRAQDKTADKKQQAGMQKVQTLISFGTALVGALFGKGVTKGTISQTGTTLRRATQIGKDSQDVSQAEEGLATYQKQLQDLEDQMNAEISSITGSGEDITLETISIRPRKSDTSIEKVGLLWWS
jgi:hypothetical protein